MSLPAALHIVSRQPNHKNDISFWWLAIEAVKNVRQGGNKISSHLYDTMEDLLVTFLGAIAFNLFAAIYDKKHRGFIGGLLIEPKERKKESLEETNHEV